jgi:Putative auto-transporter adhesin, head GIN domain
MSILRPLRLLLIALLGAALHLAALAGAASLAVARPVEPFDAVSLRAPVDLVLRQSAKVGVEVQAAESVQPLVETVVVDGSAGRTLEIRLRRGARLPLDAKVVVTVDVTALRALALSGSGDAIGSGLRTDRLDVAISGAGDLSLTDLQASALALRIAGSGDVRLSGRAAKFSAAISGSGDIDADGLESDEMSVRIAGSGDVHIGAPATLDVSIAGSGDVSYRGKPRLTQRIAGSGSVTAR